MQRFLGYSLAILLAAGAFFSGIQFGQGSGGQGQIASIFSIFAATPAQERTTNLDDFWEVWNLLDDKFAAGTTTQNLSVEDKIQGAIDGLVDAYADPYTVYFPPADAESFSADISGEFSGVGMEVGVRNNILTIIAPLPETPAAKAGLLSGDIITAIDEKTTENMSIDQAVDLIRGPKGSEVVLTIFREGALEFQEISVIRDTIAIPTVKVEQVNDVYIIALYSFNAIAQDKMREAMLGFANSNATKLIIDVRGNPGGFLNSAVGIAGYILPSGKVVVKESFVDESKNDIFRSRGRNFKDFTKKDLVVLVDGGSASASEILAGALQDHNVATIIGSQTFGKGSVQELVELSDGSSLKVTVARWLTPNGTSISAGGLTPDIVIARTPEQRIADEDPQKAAAIRFLNGETVESEVTPGELFSSATSSVEAEQ